MYLHTIMLSLRLSLLALALVPGVQPHSLPSKPGCTLHVHHTEGCYNHSDWRAGQQGRVLPKCRFALSLHVDITAHMDAHMDIPLFPFFEARMRERRPGMEHAHAQAARQILAAEPDANEPHIRPTPPGPVQPHSPLPVQVE